jgi:hypothetical protein
MLFAEEVIPLPQELELSGNHDSPDAVELAISVAPAIAQLDRVEPEDRKPVGGDDMNVWRLLRLAVLMCPEEESVWTETVDGWHATLADASAGRPSWYGGLHSRLSGHA